MFESCDKLESIEYNNWDLSNILDLSYMFSNCPFFKSYIHNLEQDGCRNWPNLYLSKNNNCEKASHIS